VVTDVGGITNRVVASEASPLANVFIYPNPVKDKLAIRNNSESVVVEIYDLSGKLIKKSSVRANVTQQLDVSDLRNGMYIQK